MIFKVDKQDIFYIFEEKKFTIRKIINWNTVMNNKMSNLPLIVIVMVNWNQPTLTCESIDSLINQENANIQFVIVDNGSTDNSTLLIKEKFPFLDIINNSVNFGFAKAANIGIMKSLELNPDFILLINNDIKASKNMIASLVDSFSKEIGVVSPLIYYYTEPKRIWSKGGNFSSLTLDLKISQKSDKRTFNDDKPFFVEFMPACAWLIPQKIFEQIGLFDERFFMYYEDLDFCRRLKKLNLKILVVPKAKLFHKVSMSSGGEYQAQERYLMAKNSSLYFRKHMSIFQFPIIFLFKLFSAMKWTIQNISKSNKETLKAYWKGFYQGWFTKTDYE